MPVNRRLVAVVVADVVGYSRLMERDEAGTLERLNRLRAELIDPKIAEHGGRTVKTTGDGMLVEFPSATSALRCAVEIQREMGVRNLYVSPDDRIEFRVGINLGDIIVQGEDIVGDGVNVAARLETLAEPGGISVASAVWEQVHEDLGVEFIDAGEQQVKNIRKPIHVFRVALAHGADAGERRPPEEAAAVRSPHWPLPWTASVAMVALLVTTAVVWWGVRGRADISDSHEPSVRSVMVLPFSATGSDPALAAAAKQLTADVTRGLADSVRYVRVVPPVSAEAYAAKLQDPLTLAREGNVRFLIDGEVRQTGAQVTLTFRLTDAAEGRQIDTERRVITPAELTTDEAARKATSATRVLLVSALARVASAKGEAASTALDLLDRASFLPIAGAVATDREQRRLATAAIKLDANLARAYTLRALADVDLYWDDFATPAGELRDEAESDSLRAIALDPNSVGAWMARGNALRIRGNIAGAMAALERAQELDPSRYSVAYMRSAYYLDMGQPQETLKLVAKLRPVMTEPGLALQACAAYVQLAQYDRAVAECERETQLDSWLWYANLTAAYAMHGNTAKAQQARDRLMKAVPQFTLKSYQARFYSTLPPEGIAVDQATLVAGLRKAGVPE
ncbi:MAG TPA: adenylate/guanylate cyclase domain-containing protein [Casimicrobiaceae bacterium]|jgi:class 3 adenylate cyclase/TolB-like protein